jgi:hypothetical protein
MATESEAGIRVCRVPVNPADENWTSEASSGLGVQIELIGVNLFWVNGGGGGSAPPDQSGGALGASPIDGYHAAR